MGSNMRRWLSFAVDGATCAATLDDAAGTHGLLIVSGGNEIRSGAHRGMAWLAAEIAAAGHPVLRFDRRGIGDSDGDNGGFESSAADIAAALALFRTECPHLRQITALGNCDAAAALALHHDAALGPDALILANPWTIDLPDADGATDATPALPPAAAIRARYLAKLGNPRELWRLVSGGVNLRKLAHGLLAARRAGPKMANDGSVAARLQHALSCIDRPIHFLIADGDGTACAFMAHWQSTGWSTLRAKPTVSLSRHATTSHGFADDSARSWLRDIVLERLSV